jgi:hypothetical protein
LIIFSAANGSEIKVIAELFQVPSIDETNGPYDVSRVLFVLFTAEGKRTSSIH